MVPNPPTIGNLYYADTTLGQRPTWYSATSLQEISRHNDLGTWQRYLEVALEQRRKAVLVIGL